MATFRDLLNQTKAEIREVDTATADEARHAPARCCSTSASPTSTSGAPSPARPHRPRQPREQHRGPVPDRSTPAAR